MIEVLTPTVEQDNAIGLFLTGDPLIIQAGAGTGKTSTLELIARNTERLGTYVAFNRAIVREAELRFPMTVTSVTAHGLAMRAVGRRYSHRLPTVRRSSAQLGKWLGIDPVVVRYDDKDKRLAPGYLASLVLKGIARWCASAEPSPSRLYIPFVHGIDNVDPSGRRRSHNNDELRKYLAPFMDVAWADLTNPEGRLPFTHDHYLKMWQLSEPTIPGDYVLFDEAQDATPVMLAAVAHQATRGAQLVFVGDSCQPTGTKVMVARGLGAGRGGRAIIESAPIESLKVGDRVVSYDRRTGHLHRTGRPVDGITGRPFDGDLVRVGTEDHGATRYTPNHRCVVRIGNALEGKHVVYLMRRGDDYRVGRTMGQHAKQGDRLGVSLRGRQERADDVWILGVHPTAIDAAEHEHTVAWRHRLPTLTFQWSGGLMPQGALDRFWQRNGGNAAGAKECLDEIGLSIEWPFWTFADGNLLRRRPLVIRAANLIDGMEVLPITDAVVAHPKRLDGRWWVPVTVTREPFAGQVWSLDVRDHHTYVGDGLVTSNCQQIYEWRGAIDALDALEGHRAFLTQSWRFGEAIADVANLLLEELHAEIRLQGNPGLDSRVGACTPRAVLCRSNVGAIDTVLRFQRAGKRPHLVGGGEEVVRFAKAVQELQEQGHTNHPELACFESWSEVLAYVEQDPHGDELALMVHLLSEYGLQIIIDALDGMLAEGEADVIVSTAHKAKGREWPAVRLHGDFAEPSERGAGADAELRLLYVAATRCREALDARLCEPIASRLAGHGPL